jgi:MFS family permease
VPILQEGGHVAHILEEERAEGTEVTHATAQEARGSGPEPRPAAYSESGGGVGVPEAPPTQSPGPAPGPGGGEPLWRNRNYAGWWISSLVSSLGSAMSQLAYPLLMLFASGSVARAGMVGAFLNIGGLSTGLAGGVLADRFNRRALIISCDLIQAVAVASVVVAVAYGNINLVHICGVALIQGMSNGISGASMTPVLKRIVREEQFPALSASKQGRDMIARLAGPSLGGALFSMARWLPFLGDSISFVISAAGVAAIRRPLGPDLADKEAHVSALGSVKEGFEYIRTSAYLRFIVLWTALISALFGGVVLLAIALIKQRGGGPTTIGVITASAAIGGLVGALAAPLLIRRLGTKRLVVAASWAMVAVIGAMAAVPSPWELGLLGGLAVALVVPLNVALDAYQLKIVPDGMLGRVAAAMNFGSSCLLWTAPLSAGFLADGFGAPTAMLVLAGFLAALAAWSSWSRAVRGIED